MQTTVLKILFLHSNLCLWNGYQDISYAREKSRRNENFMRIQLSDHFTYGRLLRYTLPSIVMMIFTSIYSTVDGLFVSNFVGKESFAAVNLVYPVFVIISAIGFMLGAGGGAIVAMTIGEGHKQKANEYFSMLVQVTFLLGIIATVLFEVLLAPLTSILGASGELQVLSIQYGRICMLSMPFFMIQTSFQMYFNVAEKPKIGLTITVLSGLTNIILDALLVGYLGWGLRGAAVATNCSEIIGGIIPILYFARPNSSLLRLTRAPFVWRIFWKACTNGSSEMLSNIASSVVSILYNRQLLQYAGADGVAAYGAIMYVSFLFAAILLGYSSGSAPIVSYHFGAQNREELKNIFRKSIVIIGTTGISMYILAQIFGGMFTRIFVGYELGLYEMTTQGFRLISMQFLIFGFNIYGSSFFTALNNGTISACMSFLRTLIFQVICILVLPLFLQLNGIWLGVVLAEALSFVVTVFFILRFRHRYGYA